MASMLGRDLMVLSSYIDQMTNDEYWALSMKSWNGRNRLALCHDIRIWVA
jgi:hypothetical protein